MLVYRIEGPERTGPYNPPWDFTDTGRQNLATELGYAHSFDDRHPTPASDAGIDRSAQRGEFCGFADRRTLVDWFDGWADRLDKHGYRLAVYHVPPDRVTCGRRQLLFDATDLKPTKTFSVRTLLS